MKIFAGLLAVTLVMGASPTWGQAYKCVTGDRTVYSDTPCSGNASKVIDARSAGASSAAPSGGPRTAGEQNCKTAIAKQIRWNDPESIRIGSATGGEMEVAEVADTRMGVRKYSVSVNAKNPYGVYFGEKPIVCFTSQDGNRVLRLDSSAIDKTAYN